MSHTYHLTGYDEQSNVIVELQVSADQAVEILAKALESRPIEPQIVKEEESARPQRTNPNKNRYSGDDEKRNAAILRLLDRGMKPRAVAEEVGCEVQTVYNIRSRSKTGAPSGGVRVKKAPASKKTALCDECGTTGSRHFKTCSRSGSRAESIPSFPSSESVAQQSEPMSEEQYNTLREAMHDREFSTLVYASSTKIRPREINVAIKSTHYQDYLANR